MTRWTIAAGAAGMIAGAILGFAAGRAATTALWALDTARWWLDTATGHARAAARPVLTLLAIVVLAAAIIAVITIT